jgi:hypothetical protein
MLSYNISNQLTPKITDSIQYSTIYFSKNNNDELMRAISVVERLLWIHQCYSFCLSVYERLECHLALVPWENYNQPYTETFCIELYNNRSILCSIMPASCNQTPRQLTCFRARCESMYVNIASSLCILLIRCWHYVLFDTCATVFLGQMTKTRHPQSNH